MEIEKFSYDNKIVKAFMIATVIFGLVGIIIGLLARKKNHFHRSSYLIKIMFYYDLSHKYR